MPVKNVDTILYAKWVITVDPENSIHENHAIVLENGLIIETCGPDNQVLKFLPALNIPDDLLAEGLNIVEHSLKSCLPD